MNGHCHLINLAFERSPCVNPQMCEHTLMVSATYAKSLNHKWTDSDRQGKQQRRRWHKCRRHAPISTSKTGPTHFPCSFRHFLISFQSPLHLSFTVIVRYRSQTYVELQMKFTTHFALHSLGTGLWACIPYARDCRWQTGRSLALLTFSKEFASEPTLVLHHMITSQGSKATISMLSLSHFIRQGNLLQFLFPPLIYMTKFSRFSGLTSCLRIGKKHTGAAWSHVTSLLKKMFNVAHVQHHQRHMCQCNECYIETWKHENVTPEWHTPQKKQDTEANMHSGITRKRNMRSTFCWFTESCNAQCLSQFAAPFIVVRAETSITGNFWKPSTKMEHIKMVKIIVIKVSNEHSDRDQQIHLPPLAMQVFVRTSCAWPQRYVHKHDIGMCEWAFRRFTCSAKRHWVKTPAGTSPTGSKVHPCPVDGFREQIYTLSLQRIGGLKLTYSSEKTDQTDIEIRVHHETQPFEKK